MERNNIELKEFDMVFVMKDYSQPVLKINAVPKR
jgi:nucleosome binding factor SPN SPT16 subunit